MPVNMDPSKKRLRKSEPEPVEARPAPDPEAAKPKPKNPDEPDERDLAEKEWKHLWDATEVIDMDKW
ncbi:hypothetical protein [Nitrospira sp. Kam-Ns4a]